MEWCILLYFTTIAAFWPLLLMNPASHSTNFVGFYYCVFNASLSSDVSFDYQEIIGIHEASSIYVYVNGMKNPGILFYCFVF